MSWYNHYYAACPVCGSHFRKGRSDKVYCSSACRQKAYRERCALRLCCAGGQSRNASEVRQSSFMGLVPSKDG